MIRHVSYCCVNMTLRGKGKSQVFTSRGLKLGTFSINKASVLTLQNCKDLLTILKWNLDNKIYSFRIGSELSPLSAHPQVGYSLNQLPDYAEIKNTLNEVGNFARLHNMRLNCHPGPMTIISSPREEVVLNAIRDLNTHAEVAELIGDLNTLFTINIHIGGPYNDKVGTAKRFCENFKRLNPYIQKRLTIENDDKLSQYTVEDLYNLIPGIPIVYDDHHHQLNSGGLSRDKAARLSFSTWGQEVPEIHYSEPRDGVGDRAHSDYADNLFDIVPDATYDVAFEAKAKELALLRWREKSSFAETI